MQIENSKLTTLNDSASMKLFCEKMHALTSHIISWLLSLICGSTVPRFDLRLAEAKLTLFQILCDLQVCYCILIVSLLCPAAAVKMENFSDLEMWCCLLNCKYRNSKYRGFLPVQGLSSEFHYNQSLL